MKLSGKTHIPFSGEPFVALIEHARGPWRAPAHNRAIISDQLSPTDEIPTVFTSSGAATNGRAIALPLDLGYLSVGDIVRVNPDGNEIRVLYRRHSSHNALLLTERCNSRCIMCSQPPRDVDDGYIVDELIEAIPLMSLETTELGLSGGEPTLLGNRLIELIRCAHVNLPRTALHILSNGRLFKFLRFAERVSVVKHRDLMFGIPLYSDIASKHDHIVQTNDAFNETILGLLNLYRVGVRIELRVVIHRYTYERLRQLAQFIARNLPFVEQVALMGIEFTGFAKTNAQALWIDPRDYADQLASAVEVLEVAGISPRIFNHPHCLLPQSLWRFACQSISDWKNAFPSACDQCRVRDKCSGLFESSLPRFGKLCAAVD